MKGGNFLPIASTQESSWILSCPNSCRSEGLVGGDEIPNRQSLGTAPDFGACFVQGLVGAWQLGWRIQITVQTLRNKTPRPVTRL